MGSAGPDALSCRCLVCERVTTTRRPRVDPDRLTMNWTRGFVRDRVWLSRNGVRRTAGVPLPGRTRLPGRAAPQQSSNRPPRWERNSFGDGTVSSPARERLDYSVVDTVLDYVFVFRTPNFVPCSGPAVARLALARAPTPITRSGMAIPASRSDRDRLVARGFRGIAEALATSSRSAC